MNEYLGIGALQGTWHDVMELLRPFQATLLLALKGMAEVVSPSLEEVPWQMS